MAIAFAVRHEKSAGPGENLAARFFETGLQPGPAQTNPARFAQKEASPAQPSPAH